MLCPALRILIRFPLRHLLGSKNALLSDTSALTGIRSVIPVKTGIHLLFNPQQPKQKKPRSSRAGPHHLTNPVVRHVLHGRASPALSAVSNDCPHEHDFSAFGFRIVNPPPIRALLKSISEPLRYMRLNGSTNTRTPSLPQSPHRRRPRAPPWTCRTETPSTRRATQTPATPHPGSPASSSSSTVPPPSSSSRAWYSNQFQLAGTSLHPFQIHYTYFTEPSHANSLNSIKLFVNLSQQCDFLPSLSLRMKYNGYNPKVTIVRSKKIKNEANLSANDIDWNDLSIECIATGQSLVLKSNNVKMCFINCFMLILGTLL